MDEGAQGDMGVKVSRTSRRGSAGVSVEIDTVREGRRGVLREEWVGRGVRHRTGREGNVGGGGLRECAGVRWASWGGGGH